MRPPAVHIENLTKRFGDVIAVDAVSFEVERGGITGLLGANGAGKTTTIAMLLGLLLPTAGSITMLGEDMIRHRYRVLPRINFGSPYVDLPKRLTVREVLTVFARLFDIVDVPGRLGQLIAELALDRFIDQPTGTLSSGQRTRVALAKALINEPELLLLDEPTASLDPDTADWVRSYLMDYAARSGATLLLASHNMVEVERMCGQVFIMKTGRIVDSGPPDRLIARYGRTNLEDVFLDIARARKSGAGLSAVR